MMTSDRQSALGRQKSPPDECCIETMSNDDLWGWLPHLNARIYRSLHCIPTTLSLTRALVLQEAVEEIRNELNRRYKVASTEGR